MRDCVWSGRTWSAIGLVFILALTSCGDDDSQGQPAIADAGDVNSADTTLADSSQVDPDTTGDDSSTTDADPDVEQDIGPTCTPTDCEDFLNACEGPACPTLSDYQMVVASDGIPDEVVVQNANNNLDVVWHGDRVFLSFRTGNFHFAGPEVVLYVVSSTDQETWQYEAAFSMNTDLREPRFLSWDGRLFLYFAVLGDNPLDFAPQGSMLSEYQGPGNWTEAEELFEGDFIPWRTKVVDGVPYMVAYEGGANIYDLEGGGTLDVHWLTTADGRQWDPVVEGQPIVLTGGSSETDFVLLADGSLVAISRNEAGDDLGWGSKVCRAEVGDLGNWNCVGDTKKYDSPLLFNRGDDVWLIGRRNVTETGEYDLPDNDETDHAAHTRKNLLDYSTKPKRCSLWSIDPVELRVDFVMDLPSRGDTCFPGLIEEDPNSYSVYNYTSPIEGPDVTWVNGQAGHTLIYRMRLTFP